MPSLPAGQLARLPARFNLAKIRPSTVAAVAGCYPRPVIPSVWENKKLFEKWEKIKIVRNVANAAIEIKRSTKEIGSSLEADIEIYLGKEYLDLVKGIDLSEYFITSKALAKPMVKDDKLFKLDGIENIKVLATKAKGKKCSRCWKILENPCQRNNCGLKN